MYGLNLSFILLSFRYDFRRRVASVLQMDVARVTILPDSPSSVADGRCQQVNFMICGKAAAKNMANRQPF